MPMRSSCSRFTHTDAHRQIDQRIMDPLQRRVGNDECGDGSHHEQNSAGGFQPEKSRTASSTSDACAGFSPG